MPMTTSNRHAPRPRPASRRRVWAFLSLALGAWLALDDAAGTITVVDDAQRTVTLAQPAQRVVSLAPHVTEILFAAGAGARVVGTMAFSDYPAEARRIPRVGTHRKVDLEQLLTLEPDLVVAWHSGNPRADLDQIERLGLTLFVSEPRRVEDIASNVLRLGHLTGVDDEAVRVAQQLRAGVRELTALYAHRAPVTVLYQIWGEPVITLNGNHLVSDLLERCGGVNVFAELTPLAPRVDVEAVLTRDPQAIVASGADAARPTWLDAWRRWPTLEAVRKGHLYHIDPDVILRHTPRVLRGMQRLCQLLDGVRGDALSPRADVIERERSDLSR